MHKQLIGMKHWWILCMLAIFSGLVKPFYSRWPVVPFKNIIWDTLALGVALRRMTEKSEWGSESNNKWVQKSDRKWVNDRKRERVNERKREYVSEWESECVNVWKRKRKWVRVCDEMF